MTQDDGPSDAPPNGFPQRLRSVATRWLTRESEALKSALVRTPFEEPARRIRRVILAPIHAKHPELRDIHEEGELVDRVMEMSLRSDSRCIDVGCHLGSMLSLFLRLAPDGHHIAFEPMPDKVARLRRRFPEVEVHALALADRKGEVRFMCNRSQSGFSGLTAHGDPGDVFEEVTVRSARLDDIIGDDEHIDMLKVDVEGNEISVLRGARETIRRVRPRLLFESTRSGLEGSGRTPSDVWQVVCDELGYTIYTPRDFTENGAPLDHEAFVQAHVYPFRAFNFVGVPPT